MAVDGGLDELYRPLRHERPLRMVLFGAKGMLARKVIELAPGGLEVHGYDLPELDITRCDQVRRCVQQWQPDIILNCAAYTAVDRCEAEEEAALAVNGEAVACLAKVAGELDALLVHLSTDYVFDGRGCVPYRESDPVAPQSAYGRSKLAGEEAILASGLKRHLIVRTSWLYGPGGKNFVDTILELAAVRDELRVVDDQVGCPTYTGDLAEALYRLIAAVLLGERSGRSDGFGRVHFSNAGSCTWHALACAAVAAARELGWKLVVDRIEPIPTEAYPLPAPRPAYSVMSKDRYALLTGCTVPTWQDGLLRFLRESDVR